MVEFPKFVLNLLHCDFCQRRKQLNPLYGFNKSSQGHDKIDTATFSLFFFFFLFLNKENVLWGFSNYFA